MWNNVQRQSPTGETRVRLRHGGFETIPMRTLPTLLHRAETLTGTHGVAYCRSSVQVRRVCALLLGCCDVGEPHASASWWWWAGKDVYGGECCCFAAPSTWVAGLREMREKVSTERGSGETCHNAWCLRVLVWGEVDSGVFFSKELLGHGQNLPGT